MSPLMLPFTGDSSDWQLELRDWFLSHEDTGIEFTWSVWLLYNVIDGDKTKTYRPVFVKGDGKKYGEYASVNHGPGVYFGPGEDVNSNTLYILMDTVANPSTRVRTNTEIIKIDNLPISKYFHLRIIYFIVSYN